MDGADEDADPDARELVGDIRSYQFGEARRDGEVLSIAALMRCAHILDAMTARDSAESDPLLALGLRDVLETSVNGLLCLVDPGAFHRFAKRDLESRRQIVNALEMADQFDELRGGWSGDTDDVPLPLQFAQRVDRLVALGSGAFADEADAARTKAMYAMLCNFAMHGGAGVLDPYLTEDGDGISLVPVPAPIFPADQTIGLAARMSGRLFSELKARREPE